MDRRKFVVSSAAGTAAGLLSRSLLAARAAMSSVGVQLFSIPKMLSDNFRSGIAMLSQIGFTEVELFSPFSFSDTEAIKRWAAITPQLGFSGNGRVGNTAQQVRTLLDENHITAPATHTDPITLQQGVGALVEAGHTLVASLPSG